jgi:hypothetical protein
MSQEYQPLSSTKIAGDYQREWAKGLRAQITSGEKYAFVNADTPHELFHHMGVPIVTNQWWSAIIAAKQLSEFYFDYMQAAGFHDRLARYSSLPLIAELDIVRASKRRRSSESLLALVREDRGTAGSSLFPGGARPTARLVAPGPR